MGIPPNGYAFSCWQCGSHSAVDTIAEWLGCSKSAAYQAMKAYEGAGKVYRQYREYSPVQEVTLPGVKFTPLELTYMDSRGITPELRVKHDIRSGGVYGFFAHRIVLPIYKNKEIVSATSRAITLMEPRYLTLPPDKELLHHKHTLFNWDNLPGLRGAVLEGPIDVIKGGDGFLGTYGTKISPTQLLTLCQLHDILFVLDNDDAGKAARDKYSFELASMSSCKVEAVLIDSKYSKDLGGLPDGLIQEIREEFNLD